MGKDDKKLNATRIEEYLKDKNNCELCYLPC